MRPEEERSQHEPSPEIDPLPARPTSPLDQAQLLVTQWEATLGRPHIILPNTNVIVLTNDVRDRMRDELAALLNAQISREYVQP